MFTPDDKNVRQILNRILIPDTMITFRERLSTKGSDKIAIKRELRDYIQARILETTPLKEFHIDVSKSANHIISDTETRLCQRFYEEAKQYENWQDRYFPEKVKINPNKGQAATRTGNIPTPPPAPVSPYTPKEQIEEHPRYVAPHVLPNSATQHPTNTSSEITIPRETVVKETKEVVKLVLNHDIIIPPRFRVQPNFMEPYHNSPCGKYKAYQIDWRLLPALCKNGLSNWRTAILDPANEMYYNDLMSILFIVTRDGEIILKENRRDTFFILR